MRVLLILAAIAVGALVWPRDESRRAGRAPAAGARADLPAGRWAAEAALATGDAGAETADRGQCVLRLRLLDEATGQPLASHVELWRLGLPEDERWTAGDERQLTTHMGPDGCAFSRLPAGRYRLAVRGQSFVVDDDPPAFVVRDAVTDLALPVCAPRSHRVYLRMFDQRGREHRTAEFRRHCSTSRSRPPTEPAWARRRRPKGASAHVGLQAGVGGGGGAYGGEWRVAPWTEAGFDLGCFREDTRWERRTTKVSLVVARHSNVFLSVSGRLDSERTYVAAAVSLEELHDLVFLPDGRRALDAGALFEVRSRAVEVKPPLSPDAWRSEPVRVRVALAGYDLLIFDYHLDRPTRPQVMRRRVYG
jgi:hypothetical protein